MSDDPRTTPARKDLAAASLEGVVRAERYLPVRRLQVIAPSLAVRSEPREGAEQVDQLLFGETFEAVETVGGFAWGQARRDGYVGFAAVDGLAEGPLVPTHWVCALRTVAFAEPSIKSRAIGPISLNALVTASEAEGPLLPVGRLGWIPRRHLLPVGRFLSDPAAVAELFVGTPYLWGGRDSLGLDCSGLVQQALYACGAACPRDADQQAMLGQEADPDWLQRGDLIFWDGHVAMILDAKRLIHANAHHMAVVIESVEEAVDRIAATAGGPLAYRRLSPGFPPPTASQFQDRD